MTSRSDRNYVTTGRGPVIELPYPRSTAEDLFEELARVDRALDRADEGVIVDPVRLMSHKLRLQKTRDEVLDRLAQLEDR